MTPRLFKLQIDVDQCINVLCQMTMTEKDSSCEMSVVCYGNSSTLKALLATFTSLFWLFMKLLCENIGSHFKIRGFDKSRRSSVNSWLLSKENVFPSSCGLISAKYPGKLDLNGSGLWEYDNLMSLFSAGRK